MNPLASTKCAGRLLMALAAISSIILMAACGSGGAPAIPNPVGFSNSNLKGTYVISIAGTDVNLTAQTESFFAIVGTMSADGNGNISGGTVDINDVNLGAPFVFTAQTVSKSTYNVSPDGRGTGTLVTPAGTFGLDFVLTSNNHGLITRFDTGGTGSGTLDLQGSATQSQLTSLAFSLAGSVNSSQNSIGTAGAFTLSSTGTITPPGIQDFNDSGSSAGLTSLALNGQVVLSSGTAQLDTAFGSLAFDVWVIDSTHLKLIETDTTSGVALAGDAFTQQTSFTAGQTVFTVGGFDLSGDPVVAGGFATTDVNGNLSNGLEDYNNDGTTGTVPTFTGSCNATAPFTAGRCQLTSIGFTNGVQGNLIFAAYPSSGGALLLEVDSLGLLQGAAYAQTATSFAAPQGYGLNLSGSNGAGVGDGEVDTIAQFNATTAASPATNMTGIVDENDLSTPLKPIPLTGTYAPGGSSPADGRGSILATTTGTFMNLLTLEYYVVDGSTMIFIEGDTEQASVGTFQVQSAASDTGMAQSHLAMVHPVIRPHAAAWHHK